MSPIEKMFTNRLSINNGWRPYRYQLARGLSGTVIPKNSIYDQRDLEFQLFEVLNVEQNLFSEKFPRFQQHTIDLVKEAVRSAGQIAAKSFAPHNRKNDLVEPRFDGNKVIINPEVSMALKEFYEAGFGAAHADEQFGGTQLPACVTNSLMMPFYSANIGTVTFPFLTIAAGNMLRKFGSESQLQRFLKPMLEGRFSGTMNLSETQAGSSLGDITTRAFPRPGEPGKYDIRGTKIAGISGGEHELSENIVHMVLAKVADSAHPERTPPGVKGISLFIVPKRRVNEDGSLGELNDISLGGLNKKMGWRGATNCVLNYGENNRCIGELMGAEGKGLAVMFNMMNEARISVGLIATSLGYNGYAASLNYARDRKQGRPLENKDPTVPQIPIVNHPDVKRMLLVQKAYIEGALALCLYASYLVDSTHYAKEQSAVLDDAVLLDLLTPIVKSWPSEWCLEANKWAIQVHGGYGYERSYSVEQTYRDNRLNMIHEGTNGIQSLDLLGRKMKTKGPQVLRERIEFDIEAASNIHDQELRRRAASLNDALLLMLKVADDLVGQAPAAAMANSHEFLNMSGHVVIAWMWLRQETAAVAALRSSVSNDDRSFYEGKRVASQYFFQHELPKIEFQSKLLISGDETVLKMRNDLF